MLQPFLSARLLEVASRPAMDEIVARIGARESFSIAHEAIVEAIEVDRIGRADASSSPNSALPNSSSSNARRRTGAG